MSLPEKKFRKHPEKLTAKQRRGVAALLCCTTFEEAAQTIGVSPRTLWQWRQSEAFQEVLKTGYHEAIKQSITAAQSASDRAVQVLREIMDDPRQPAGARIAAAKYIDQRHWHLVQYGELLAEFEEIRRLIDQREELDGI